MSLFCNGKNKKNCNSKEVKSQKQIERDQKLDQKMKNNAKRDLLISNEKFKKAEEKENRLQLKLITT